MDNKANMRIWDCIKWLWNASVNYRSPILLRGVIGLLHAGVSLFSIWVCKSLIDVATLHSDGNMRTLVMLIVGCLAVRLLLSVTGGWLGSRTEVRLRNALRYRLFERLMGSCWTGRETLHTGDIINRMAEDTSTVTSLFCRSIPAVMVMTAPVDRRTLAFFGNGRPSGRYHCFHHAGGPACQQGICTEDAGTLPQYSHDGQPHTKPFAGKPAKPVR